MLAIMLDIRGKRGVEDWQEGRVWEGKTLTTFTTD
jgi:hypothetical protein